MRGRASEEGNKGKRKGNLRNQEETRKKSAKRDKVSNEGMVVGAAWKQRK